MMSDTWVLWDTWGLGWGKEVSDPGEPVFSNEIQLLRGAAMPLEYPLPPFTWISLGINIPYQS